MWASGASRQAVGRPQSRASATRSCDRAQPQGGPLAESRNPICPLHCPILMALGAANEWTAQVTEAYVGLSTTLCLWVCAAGLFGDDLLQHGGYHRRRGPAHIAVRPGAPTRHTT